MVIQENETPSSMDATEQRMAVSIPGQKFVYCQES